jgi:glycosyltransferase involved in cell wall biosynthesis
MRIARILTRLNLGGPARQALASDPLLRARGHEVRILTGESEPGEGDLFQEFRRRGLDVERIPGLSRSIAPLRDLFVLVRLRRALADFRPDLVHTHASKAGALGRAALKRGPGAKRVARVHTFHGHVLAGYFSPLIERALVAHEKRLARLTDRVVAVSHATADDLVRLGVVEEERLVVIQPGVELDQLLELPRPRLAPSPLRVELGARDTDVVVGVLGRLAAVKRPCLALDVFELLAARHVGLQLAFVGDGSERGAVERRIQALPADLRRRAHLLGARTDVPAVLAGLDVLLLTSRAEGMPVSLIEGAAAGLPCVAMDVGGVSELVAHERTGFLGRSVDELALGLDGLVASPELRLSCGARARMRVARANSAERLAQRLEELYRLVVEERQR